MKKGLLIVFCLFTSVLGWSQSHSSKENSLNLSIAVGQTQGALAASWQHDWQLGKKQKFVVGLGVRATGYVGRNQNYVTAPAKLTSGKTGLGVIFTENIAANIDTFLVAKPNVFAINGLINLGYRFNEKFTLGFNIDAIGFSFGGKRSGNYINGNQGRSESAKPTSFNVLLTSDNDRGTLNSEFYGQYVLNERWRLHVGVQFLFTEYTTYSKVQQRPESNDRFRNKSLMFMIGAGFKLN